jgi:ubiquinone/menaquinone biosynthesis C-methylase UbiE
MESMQREVPWYKKWFDENYLLLYQHRNFEDAREQVRLIMDTLKLQKGSIILDLCCGEGRYTILFREFGYRVMGLDLSEIFIIRGKEKYPRLNLVVADMGAIPVLPGRFDLVLSLFTSFGYFEEDEENEKMIDEVHRSLKPGGFFWLDFLNTHYIENNLLPENSSQISPSLRVVEKRKIKDRRIIKDIFFQDSQREVTGRHKESVRLFTRNELEIMMKKTGFQVAGCFGNYRGDAWNGDSERTILVGRKEL